MNTQHRNHHMCSTTGFFLLLILLFCLTLNSQFVLMLVNEKNSLNEEDIMQLRDNIVQMILNVGIPLIIYVKNKKLFEHVKEEILNLF